MRSFDHHIQSDVAILDFSRAFDSVPHECLLSKLEHYGIRGPIHSTPGSDHSFLFDRCGQLSTVNLHQKLTQNLSPTRDRAWSTTLLAVHWYGIVEFNVPLDTVQVISEMGLLFINDLPDIVSVGTTVRLFADDCIVYREIKSVEDQRHSIVI